MKTVKVYGPGCKRCETVAIMVRDTAAKLDIEIELEKVSDAKSIAMAGVMSTPGLAIDGKLVHAGGLPREDAVEQWLKD
ncbi:thioredoxin family protein [Breoghania sp.]|uniref:thioredoxin family protein n=1 Tax=Breoghania sp. TaxID=2065378 RepID=UPI0029CA0664|nr:thioredoxin family protein [Breoghania sp.]